MKIKLTFETIGGTFTLPVHYNHIVQSFIYNNISPELASFLHEKGYVHGKRSFKLFTFSRLLGKFKLNKDKIKFDSPVSLHIASSESHFIQELAESFIKTGNLKFGRQSIQINSVEVCPKQRFSKEIIINTLSPITVYSTLSTKDGRKKTYYYSPYEKEFSELILENLRKKFKLVHKKEPGKRKLIIEPLNRKSISEKIVKYKGTVIKGWMGKFRLKGSPSLIYIAYDTGLGSKNSQGFGMFEVIKG